MAAPLRILHVEDSPRDAELLYERLEQSDLAFEVQRVATRADFERELAEGGFDLILCDYKLPGFSAGDALAIALQRCPHAPFIIVSGTIGEERAVEALKAGATDYVLKDRTGRLGLAIRRALQDCADRTKREQMEEQIRESEARMRAILDSALDAIIGLDATGRITDWNPRAGAIFNWTREEALGRSLDLIISARYRKSYRRGLGRFLETGKGPFVNRLVEITALHRDGTEFPIEIATTPVKFDGSVHFTAFIADISERKRTEQYRELDQGISRALIESATLDEANHGILEAFCTVLGWEWSAIWHVDKPAQVLRHMGTWHKPEIVVPEFEAASRTSSFASGCGLPGRVWAGGKPISISDYAQEATFPRAAFAAKEGIHGAVGFPIRLRGDTIGVMEFFSREVRQPDRNMMDFLARLSGQIGLQIDRKRSEEQIKRLAYHDEVTGLSNRAQLQEHLTHAIMRRDSILALVFLDLDRFTEINDTLGFRSGNRLLREVADRLTSTLPEALAIARLASDSFAVLLESDEHGAVEAVQRIADALGAPFSLEGLNIEIGACQGVALCPEHGRDPLKLIRNAEVAMNLAKAREHQHVVYSARLDPHRQERLKMISELRQGLESLQLVLHYQPKIRLATGQVMGVEALVRWRHPRKGLMLPLQFIPLAERTGLIKPLTEWAIETAMRQAREWRAAGEDLTVAVNLSARNLQDPRIIDLVPTLLETLGLPADRLTLEITESVIMADPARAIEQLKRLHGIGVTLAVDDFGTGYSSLAYLKKLPVQEIKIDRAFVKGLMKNRHDAAIVRATADIARNMGMKTVAEGIEDVQTFHGLMALGCDEGQGYFMSKPLPPEELARWLNEPQPWRPRNDASSAR